MLIQGNRPMKMRTLLFALTLLIYAPCFLQSQDMTTLEPKGVKVLESVDSTRVLEISLPAGQTIRDCSHPPCVIYCVTELAIKSVSQNGESTVTWGRPGEIIWIDKGITHSETNVGESEVVFYITELRDTLEPGQEKIKKTKDVIIDRLQTLAARAFQHRIRPLSMGGGFSKGKGSFEGFEIPPRMRVTVDAMYEWQILDEDHISFTAVSPLRLGIIHGVVNERGEFVSWYFDEKFR